MRVVPVVGTCIGDETWCHHHHPDGTYSKPIDSHSTCRRDPSSCNTTTLALSQAEICFTNPTNSTLHNPLRFSTAEFISVSQHPDRLLYNPIITFHLQLQLPRRTWKTHDTTPHLISLTYVQHAPIHACTALRGASPPRLPKTDNPT